MHNFLMNFAFHPPVAGMQNFSLCILQYANVFAGTRSARILDWRVFLLTSLVGPLQVACPRPGGSMFSHLIVKLWTMNIMLFTNAIISCSFVFTSQVDNEGASCNQRGNVAPSALRHTTSTAHRQHMILSKTSSVSELFAPKGRTMRPQHIV